MFLRLIRSLFLTVLVLLPLSSAAQSHPTAAQPLTINDFILAMLGHHGPSDAVLRFNEICSIESDAIEERVFREYGAVFISHGVSSPQRCVFNSESEVNRFQSELKTESLSISGTRIELQQAAAKALRNAVDEAEKAGKSITPLDGAIAGKRNFSDTVRIWNSRFYRALDHWVLKGKITREEANYATTLPVKDQVKRVMAWEASGYYFSTNFSMSIFNSVAPPGTSQHLSLLAFDVFESSDPVVRQIMNKYGWFQTIRSDEPHFTFIGVSESELPRRGLTPLKRGSRTYWIPNVKMR